MRRLFVRTDFDHVVTFICDAACKVSAVSVNDVYRTDVERWLAMASNNPFTLEDIQKAVRMDERGFQTNIWNY